MSATATKNQIIGGSVEAAGAISVFAGTLLSFHHLAIALTVGLGLAAIYVGRIYFSTGKI